MLLLSRHFAVLVLFLVFLLLKVRRRTFHSATAVSTVASADLSILLRRHVVLVSFLHFTLKVRRRTFHSAPAVSSVSFSSQYRLPNPVSIPPGRRVHPVGPQQRSKPEGSIFIYLFLVFLFVLVVLASMVSNADSYLEFAFCR